MNVTFLNAASGVGGGRQTVSCTSGISLGEFVKDQTQYGAEQFSISVNGVPTKDYTRQLRDGDSVTVSPKKIEVAA